MGEKDSHFSLGFKLSGSNYHVWAGNMEAHIKGKGLWGYVQGSISEPEPKLSIIEKGEIKILEGEDRQKALEEYSKKHDEWEMKNFKILSWIFSSVETKINANIIKFKRASEAWLYLEKMYTSRDLSHKYYLQKKALTLQQNDLSIREYFAELSSIWDELAMLEPKWSGEAIELRHKQLEEDRFFNFLNGLRPEFEQIRSSLLSAFTSPSIEDVITKLSGEETRMGISKNNPSILATPSQSDYEVVNAVSRPGNNLKTYKPPHFKNQGQNDRYGKRDYSKLTCHFCKEPGHIKPNCPK
jgi:hypothetical protein